MVIRKKIHFIGICGYAMSGAAVMLKKMGYQVTGSDLSAYPPVSKVIDQEKIPRASHFARQNLNLADLVVVGNQISPNNPEVKEAQKKSLKLISLPELIGKFFGHKKMLVVAGTHGKTTTSAMLSWVLIKAGLKPSYLIGGIMKNTGRGFALTENEWLVLEGDEYRTAFFDRRPKIFHYQPEVAVLTSCEMDHPDYFKNFASIKKTFWTYLNLVPKSGMVVANIDDESVLALFKKIRRPKISFALRKKADFQAVKIIYSKKQVSFAVKKKGRFWSKFNLSLPGEINVRNALAVIAVADYLGIDVAKIRQGLASFQGVKRRFEIVNQDQGITIIDDYAHHPTKIRKTLEAARTRYPNNKIYCVFEPHTYSRTRFLLPDYALSFNLADEVIIAPLMPAREKNQKATVDSQTVVEAIKKYQPKVKFISTSGQVLAYLTKKLRPGEVIIIMSVGGMNNLAGQLALWLSLRPLVRLNEPLKKHTTFRLGGPADLFLSVKNQLQFKKAIRAAKKFTVPCFILGSGSNILVTDRGFRGLVIKNQTGKIHFRGNLVEVESGVLTSVLVKKTIEKGLAGLENFWGLPGTVGGAVSGSAHFWGQTIKPLVKKIVKINNVILAVVFRLKKGNSVNSFKKAQAGLNYRQQTQPLVFASAGCIFKNPTGKHAGVLIEQCGLKGKKQGGAKISEKHANFIINTGRATSNDVVRLIKLIKKRVKGKFKITLEEEIIRIKENYE